MCPNACGKVLASLEIFRFAYRSVPLGSIIAFLQVCENEGMSVKDLAFRCGFSVASVSRFLRALHQPPRQDAAACNGLLHVVRYPGDGRRRSVFLTADGRQLRDEIEALFA